MPTHFATFCSRLRPRRLFTFIPLSGLLCFQLNAWAAPAEAPGSLTQHLSAYPFDTAAISVSRLQLQKWQQALDQLPPEAQEIRHELQSMLTLFEKETNIELKRELGHLGSYFSLGYVPPPEDSGRRGEFLMVLDIRSQDRAQDVLERLHLALSPQREDLWQRQHFGDIEYHSIDLQEDDYKLHLALQGGQILACVSPEADALKDMLYLNRVHLPNSRWRLINSSRFKQTQKVLAQHNLWGYVSSRGLLASLMYFLGLDTTSPQLQELMSADWTQDTLRYFDHLGLGYSVRGNQLLLTGYRGHLQDFLSDYQQEFTARNLELQDVSRAAVVGHIPEESFLLLSGHSGSWGAWPSDAQRPEGLSEFDAMFSGMSDGLWERFKSSLSEALQHVDGPFALGVSGTERVPQWHLALSLKGESDVAGLLSEKLPQVLNKNFQRQGRPPAQRFQMGRGSFQDRPFFTLEIPADMLQELGAYDDTLSQLPAVWQLSFAQQGDRLVLASSPEGLKKMLTAQNLHPQLMAQQLQTRSAPVLMLDLKQLSSWLGKIEDREVQEISRALEDFQQLFIGARDLADGTRGELRLHFEKNKWFQLLDAPLFWGFFLLRPNTEMPIENKASVDLDEDVDKVKQERAESEF